jgi:hypothetical protein
LEVNEVGQNPHFLRARIIHKRLGCFPKGFFLESWRRGKRLM